MRARAGARRVGAGRPQDVRRLVRGHRPGALLAERGVGRLVVAGAQTDECIRSTIHGAFVRGYDVTLVGDAHTTEDLTEYGAPPPEQVIAHTNLYWQWASAPGRRGETLASADVSFSLYGPPQTLAPSRFQSAISWSDSRVSSGSVATTSGLARPALTLDSSALLRAICLVRLATTRRWSPASPTGGWSERISPTAADASGM